MRPDFRVSIDDRGDFYGDDYVYSFINTTNGSAGWDDRLKKGNYDSLLLDPYLRSTSSSNSFPNGSRSTATTTSSFIGRLNLTGKHEA